MSFIPAGTYGVSIQPAYSATAAGPRIASGSLKVASSVSVTGPISNLVMNAAVHGEHVAISAKPRLHGGVEITVDDDGPGIAADRYEDAFKAFNRLDESRNQNEKGVGLGLAIARDVARGHGGDITLDRSPLGGLRAIVRLPG